MFLRLPPPHQPIKTPKLPFGQRAWTSSLSSTPRARIFDQHLCPPRYRLSSNSESVRDLCLRRPTRKHSHPSASARLKVFSFFFPHIEPGHCHLISISRAVRQSYLAHMVSLRSDIVSASKTSMLNDSNASHHTRNHPSLVRRKVVETTRWERPLSVRNPNCQVLAIRLSDRRPKGHRGSWAVPCDDALTSS